MNTPRHLSLSCLKLARLFRVAILASALLGAVAFGAPELRPLRDGTELFVDDVDVAMKRNVTRRVHAAAKLDRPVLEPDKPWEGGDIYLYGTTHRDPATGAFRMWYCTGSKMLLATSRDGLTWTKPELDVELIDGAKSNVVLPALHGAAVIVDDIEPDPAKRYKALASEQIRVGGFSGYYSADGIHWQQYGTERVLTVGSELGHAIRDPATKKYFAYIRPYSPKFRPQSMQQKRLGAVATSDDFVHWSEMQVVLTPDSIDDAWVTQPEHRTEFYAMNGFAYGRSYVGILPIFRITQINDNAPKGQSRYDGPMNAQLVVSRDGLTWQRMAERDPVIASGTGYDRSIMNVAVMPLIIGDEIWHYFTALNVTHGGPIPPRRTTLGLARWRLDGYVSLDAAGAEGVVETRPFVVKSGGLEVNAAAVGGRLVVEVLDDTGQPIDGFAATDFAPLTTDHVRHRARWKERTELPAGRSLKLRFRLSNASLYSYTVHRAP